MNAIDTNLKKILADADKRRSWVLYQLHLQGRSLAEVGYANGVMHRQNLYETFRKPYPRLEKIIAEAVGLTPQQLFPERYDEDGLPNRRRGRPIKKANTKTLQKDKGKRNIHSPEVA